MPDIPWTIKTPIFKYYYEKEIWGSMTFITVYITFFWPPLGFIIMLVLNYPIAFPSNFKLTFFVSYPDNFSLFGLIIKFPVDYKWITKEFLDVFLISKPSSKSWPIHNIGLFKKASHLVVNLGSWTLNEHNIEAYEPSKTFKTNLYV